MYYFQQIYTVYNVCYQMLFESDNDRAKRNCFETFNKKNTNTCSTKTGKQISSQKDFILKVKLKHSLFVNYNNLKSCIKQIEPLGFEPCDKLYNRWKKNFEDKGLTLINISNQPWTNKSFSASKCIKYFEKNNIKMCHQNISTCTPIDLKWLQIWINDDIQAWQITIPYQNEDYNFLSLCTEKFQNKGFKECITTQTNNSEVAGEASIEQHYSEL